MPTTLVDASSLYADMTVAYTYDDLYRLTQAASTSTDSALTYTKNWTYGAVGNILTSTDCGTYSYLGYQAGNYANPHAVTSVCGKTYTYDRNGNVTSDGTWTNAWNWRNELTQSTSGTTTVTYAYGHDGNRVSQSSTSGNSLVYPNGYYTVDGTETKRHVMAGALGSVATSTYDGTASEFVYHHKDHLGGTHIETDDTGAVLEYIIYKPFGDTLLDTKSSTYENDLKYTGKEKDVDTGYYYYGARYYMADYGRFMSQDPIYLGLGASNHGILTDPQALNSYAYGRNNPVRFIDPDGRAFFDNLAHYGMGVFNAWGSNMLGGMTRADSSNAYYQLGQLAGDAASMAQGAAEIASGITGGVIGTAVTSTGIGAAVGVPATAVSAAIATHGVATLGLGAYHFSQGAGSIYTGSGGASGMSGGGIGTELGNASGKTVNGNTVVPSDWSVTPARSGNGFRYTDPTNSQNQIRLMQGNPNSAYESSRGPYMRVHTQNGYLDANGKVSSDRAATHIPIKDIQ